MKTLIVYSTKYGSTEKCVEMLKQELTGEVDLCNLKHNKKPNIDNYDNVIIGGPVFIGKLKKDVSTFVKKNLNQLLEKRVGLFICGIRPGEEGVNQLYGYPKSLLDHAVTKEIFGGEITFNKMNFIDRKLTKMVSNADNDFPKLDENLNGCFIKNEKIKEFAEKMSRI